MSEFLLQYPVQAAIDPLALDASEADRLQWYAPLSEPTYRRAREVPTWITADPAALNEPGTDNLQWYEALSVPSRSRDTAHVGSITIDGDVLADTRLDDLTWYPTSVELIFSRLPPSLGWITGPPEQLDSSVIVTYARVEFPEAGTVTPEVVTLDEYQHLSVPVPPRVPQQPDAWVSDLETLGAAEEDRLQWYAELSRAVRARPATPGEYAIDPETLGAPETDRLQWFVPLALPTRRLDQVAHSWIALEPGTVGAPETDRLQWYAPLSEPTRPRLTSIEAGASFVDHIVIVPSDDVSFDWYAALSEPVRPEYRQQPESAIIDPATLDDALRDELQWFMPFSVPVLPRRDLRFGMWFVTDDETLGVAERDELRWHRDLDLPVLPRAHVAHTSYEIDPQVLGAPEADRLQWYKQLAQPTYRRTREVPTWITIDAEALGAAALDSLEWYAAFSTPNRRIARAAEAYAIFVPEADEVDVTTDWVPPLSEPTRPIYVQQPDAWVSDLETLGDPEADHLQWFAEMSVPTLPRPDLSSVPAWWTDPATLDEALRDELQWFAEMSVPQRRHLLSRLIPTSGIDSPAIPLFSILVGTITTRPRHAGTISTDIKHDGTVSARARHSGTMGTSEHHAASPGSRSRLGGTIDVHDIYNES